MQHHMLSWKMWGNAEPTATLMFLKLGNFNMPGLQVPEFPTHPHINTNIQKGIQARFKQFSTHWL